MNTVVRYRPRCDNQVIYPLGKKFRRLIPIVQIVFQLNLRTGDGKPGDTEP